MVAVNLLTEELEGGGYHIFVRVRVDGKACRFLVDTGASKTVVDKKYYEKHLSPKKKLEAVNQETTGLHSSVSETHIGTIRELAIGKHLIKSCKVAAVDLTHVNTVYRKLKKPKIQGILGSDLLMEYKMCIDFATEKIMVP